MSITAYFIGGPMDKTKRVLEGDPTTFICTTLNMGKIGQHKYHRETLRVLLPGKMPELSFVDLYIFVAEGQTIYQSVERLIDAYFNTPISGRTTTPESVERKERE